MLFLYIKKENPHLYMLLRKPLLSFTVYHTLLSAYFEMHFEYPFKKRTGDILIASASAS